MPSKVDSKMLSTTGNVEYETPDPIYKDLDRVFHFGLDVCATPRNYKHINFYSDPTLCMTCGHHEENHGQYNGLCLASSDSFGHSPCKHKCKQFKIDPKCRDGLLETWSHHPTVWMNPPYSSVETWIQKAWAESLAGCTVVSLLAWRHDTEWFFDNVLEEAKYILPLKKRIRFWVDRDPKGAGPTPSFPSLIAIFTKREWPDVEGLKSIGGHAFKVIRRDRKGQLILL